LPTGLTHREVEVLAQLAAGKSDKEIGAELYIAPSTVSNHVRNIFQKTETGNRTEAALFAVKNGIAADAGAPQEHE
jgi:DNA-binding NarL/FixJ family response regulator